MKNSVLFKSLIDIFFFLHVLGLFALLIKFSSGFIRIKNVEPFQLWEWIILSITCITYFIFLQGLFFLRKMARKFLVNQFFNKTVVSYMKKTGNQFIYAGLLTFGIMLTEIFLDLNFEAIPKSFSVTPIFLIIVGIFFTIQSKILKVTIKIKDENDLIV